MNASPFKFASAAVRRLLSGRVSAFLWVLLLTVPFAPALLFTLSDAVMADHAVYATNIVLGVGTSALTLFTFWKLERALANYRDKQGDPFGWFGWTLVAYLPVFAVAFAVWRVDVYDDIFFQDTLTMAALCFTVPILVHASGRAIDQYGLEINAVWQFWLPNYWALVVGYLTVTLPFYLASDIIWHFAGALGPNALIVELVSSLLHTAGSAFAVALTVEAFHRAEAIPAS